MGGGFLKVLFTPRLSLVYTRVFRYNKNFKLVTSSDILDARIEFSSNKMTHEYVTWLSLSLTVFTYHFTVVKLLNSEMMTTTLELEMTITWEGVGEILFLK